MPFYVNQPLKYFVPMDWSNVLWRESHKIGLIPSILCAVAWLGCGGLVVRYGVAALWRYEWLAWALLIVLDLVVSLGVLVSFWILMSHYAFRRRGYQVRWLTGDDWVYEERRADGSTECFPPYAESWGTATLPLATSSFSVRTLGSGKLNNGHRGCERRYLSASPTSLALTKVAGFS